MSDTPGAGPMISAPLFCCPVPPPRLVLWLSTRNSGCDATLESAAFLFTSRRFDPGRFRAALTGRVRLNRPARRHSAWNRPPTKPNEEKTMGTIRSTLRNWLSRRTRRPERAQLAVTPLEDRTVPSGTPTVINFDDLPAGTVVTNQYQSKG